MALSLAVFLSCNGIACANAGAQQAPSQPWHNIDFVTHSSTFYDAFRDQANTEPGLAADVYRALFSQMGFVPTIRLDVISRINSLDFDSESACSVLMLKSPAREAAFTFSLPVDFLLSHRLYQTNETPAVPAEVLNDKGELLSLSALFSQRENHQLIVLKGRSYGSVLDAQIRQLPDAAKYTRWGSNQYDADIRMLARGHGNYILAYPYDIHREAANFAGVSFKSTPIANNTAIRTGHIMCTKTPLTLAFLEEVNTHLRKLYHQQVYIDAHLKHTPPDSHQALHEGVAYLRSL
ncbi:hypothetical protein C6Y40_06005 [Alteromonas alba]|uniref:Solute-binding protein family 3/N-terminal domain-containing protein n=2 Tax=Alteromonas alba TaxID=2079529 RepID=A0A2S9VDG8_9ALTE|nr:hypothetical protein C6Y40_06005 [Alteromonas alba]